MKRIFYFLILSAAILLANESKATLLIGSGTTVVTAQTNSATFQTNTAYLAMPQVTISNNALGTNTAYYGYFRFSIDNGTTWFTNYSTVFVPTSTNAASYVVNAQTIQIPIQTQMLAITNVTPNNTLPIVISITSP